MLWDIEHTNAVGYRTAIICNPLLWDEVNETDVR